MDLSLSLLIVMMTFSNSTSLVLSLPGVVWIRGSCCFGCWLWKGWRYWSFYREKLLWDELGQWRLCLDLHWSIHQWRRRRLWYLVPTYDCCLTKFIWKFSKGSWMISNVCISIQVLRHDFKLTKSSPLIKLFPSFKF